jgi:hypothetical protein
MRVFQNLEKAQDQGFNEIRIVRGWIVFSEGMATRAVVA